MSDMVERVAEAISEARTGNSLSWRHYVAEAQAAIAAMQADAAPVAWMYERGSERKVYVEQSQAALACGYIETPLYAHQPVADRVSTSSPVDVGETGNTSSKLRPASVVAHEVCEEMEEYGPSFATKVIEADRQAVRAALVAKIVAWLRTDPDAAYKPADAIEAGEWK